MIDVAGISGISFNLNSGVRVGEKFSFALVGLSMRVYYKEGLEG